MLEKATLTNTVTNAAFPVLFNPEEYSISRDINYAQTAIPGLSAPILQFVNGNMQTLEMELFLDTYEKHAATSSGEQGTTQATFPGDVRGLTKKIIGLMNIESATHAPPVLVFAWGSLSFTCVLASATQRFTMFRNDGIPVRARLQVTFNEYRNLDLEARELKRETADYSHFHVVAEKEYLSTIASQVYGDPALWRPIALANGIANIQKLSIGARLIVPNLPYQDPATGKVYQ